MSKKAAILFIHGMGNQRPDFDEELKEHIYKELKHHNLYKDDIAWRTAFWADVTKGAQEEYWNNIQDRNIDFKSLRKFILHAFGDATAYANPLGVVYKKVHTKVRQALSALYEDLGKQDMPLIILAHSLGCQVMSNCIYDVQKQKISDISNFENFETLTGVMTFGCNIPLFTFMNLNDYKPFKFPSESLPNRLKNISIWKNFYDPDDVLGYPLQAIPALENKVQDIPINGSGIAGMTPLAHEFYWDDKELTKPIAAFVKEVVDTHGE